MHSRTSYSTPQACLPTASRKEGASQLSVLSEAVKHIRFLRDQNLALAEEREKQLKLKDEKEARLAELRAALMLASE